MDKELKVVMFVFGIVCTIAILAYVAVGVVLVLLATGVIDVEQWVRILCSVGLVAYGFSAGYIMTSGNTDNQVKELVYDNEEEKGE